MQQAAKVQPADLPLVLPSAKKITNVDMAKNVKEDSASDSLPKFRIDRKTLKYSQFFDNFNQLYKYQTIFKSNTLN